MPVHWQLGLHNAALATPWVPPYGCRSHAQRRRQLALIALPRRLP